MNGYYFEICITPSSFFDIFLSEIADFVNEALEEDLHSTSIIVRTTNDISTSLLHFLNHLSRNLSDINGVNVSYSYRINRLKIEDYINLYKQSVSGVVCRDFYIRPSWVEPMAGKIDIVLEPSLAFGTGHHATTFMSIESILDCSITTDTTFLDVGCGSGILSLCANKMGASVSLCDVDEMAIQESKKNFSLNNATIADIWLGSLESVDNTYDIVVANIVASVIIENSYDLISVLKANSYLILSGILFENTSLVKDRFDSLLLIDEKVKDEWVTLKFKCSPNKGV